MVFIKMGKFGRKLGAALGKGIGGFAGKELGKFTGMHQEEGQKVGEDIGADILDFLIPFKKGGKITKTTPALLHKGEFVLPKSIKPTPTQLKHVRKLHGSKTAGFPSKLLGAKSLAKRFKTIKKLSRK